MITLPSVLKKALERDAPQSRAVIAVSLADLGALVGHAVTINVSGAGVGADTGLAVALMAYKYFNPIKNGNSSGPDRNQLISQIKAQVDHNNQFLT